MFVPESFVATVHVIMNRIMEKQEPAPDSRTYFQTFDALRFFAFLKVFLFHIPVIGFPVFDFIKNGGGTAVSLFFSLSGFLITYIVLKEKQATGTLNLKAFYIRRILRIWPLYYTMLLFAFLTPFILSLISIEGSSFGYTPDWLLSALFLENYKMIATNAFPNVSPLGVMWSLCIEEHFYIVWGLVLYFVAVKNMYRVLICSVLVANAARVVFYLNGWAFLDLFTNLDYFAYGAVPAVLYIQHKTSVSAFVGNIPAAVKIAAVILCIGVVLVLPNVHVPFMPFLAPAVEGIIFAVLLFLIVFEKQLFVITQNNILSRLGIYTYGFYLTHTIVINFFVKIFEKYQLSLRAPVPSLIFVGVCLAGTVLAGVCTYYSIEKPFLSLKKRFR